MKAVAPNRHSRSDTHCSALRSPVPSGQGWNGTPVRYTLLRPQISGTLRTGLERDTGQIHTALPSDPRYPPDRAGTGHRSDTHCPALRSPVPSGQGWDGTPVRYTLPCPQISGTLRTGLERDTGQIHTALPSDPRYPPDRAGTGHRSDTHCPALRSPVPSGQGWNGTPVRYTLPRPQISGTLRTGLGRDTGQIHTALPSDLRYPPDRAGTGHRSDTHCPALRSPVPSGQGWDGTPVRYTLPCPQISGTLRTGLERDTGQIHTALPSDPRYPPDRAGTGHRSGRCQKQTTLTVGW